MAEKKVIEIDVNTKEAVKAMDNLSNATNDVSKSFQEVYGDLQPLTTRMGEAEDRLYELANAGKTTTQEYKDLLKTVGDYRKVQIKTDMAVDAAASTMGQKLGGALNGVASGFSIAQGVMGTFGAESALIEESLLKVQSAMAIQQGIEGVRESIKDFKALGQTLKANSIVQKAVNIVTAAYNAIMAANPVMAVVAGIAALIAIGYKLITMFQESAEANEDAAAATKRNTDALNQQIEASDRASESLKTRNGHEYNMAKASGASAEALRKLALKHADEEIALEKSTLATARNTYEKEKNTLANYKSLGMSDEVIEKQRELVTKSREALKEEYTDLKEAYKNKQDLALQNQVERKQEQTDAKKDAIQSAKDKIDAAKDQAAKLKEIAEQEKSDKIKAELEARWDEEEAQNLYTQILVDEEKKKLDAKKAADEEYRLWKIEDNKLTVEARESLNKTLEESDKKRLENEKEISKAKYQMAYDSLALISQVTELFGRRNEKSARIAFGIDKAAKIASSTIATIEGTIEAYKTAQKSPYTAVFPAYPAVQAGLTAAFGAAGIAKIAQTKFGGGTQSVDIPSSSGGGGGGSIMSPSFNVVGNSGINQLAQLQQTPTKAYVVSGDVTTAQSLDRNRIENATLVQ